jgi:hypothetical protein
MKWPSSAEHVEHIKLRNEYKILAKNIQGRTSLGVPWGRWEDNVKMDLNLDWKSIQTGGAL